MENKYGYRVILKGEKITKQLRLDQYFTTIVETDDALADLCKNLDREKYTILKIRQLEYPQYNWRIFLNKIPVNLELGKNKRRHKNAVK